MAGEEDEDQRERMRRAAEERALAVRIFLLRSRGNEVLNSRICKHERPTTEWEERMLNSSD